MKHASLPYRLLVLLAAAVLLLPGLSLADEANPLDDTVVSYFRRYSTRGGMVLAAKDGELVYEYAYGYTNNGKKTEITGDHYFRVASVSKLVTACAVMRLVESGRLDLDENIGQLIGGSKPYTAVNPAYPKVGITSRMLMSHTSAIWDTNFAKSKPLRDALKQRSSYYKNTRPGSAYHYSNYGAGIMGIVLEGVTGLRLNDAAKELLFDPMDLDAGYDPQFLQHPELIATRPATNREYKPEIDLENDYYHSYGQCWMRGEDLLKIGIMLCDYGLLNGERILEEETVREMLSSQQGKGGITADSPYGLNVHRLSTLVPDTMIYGHQGRIENILCNLYFDPETRFVFAFLTDSCNPGDTVDGVRYPAYPIFRLLWNEFSGGTPIKKK